MTVLSKILNNTKVQRQDSKKADLYRSLMRREAKIGGAIFGETPKGVRREFFCLDERTWIWHEEWTDESGKLHVKTTRYDIRPDGILKAQGDRNYQHVSLEEANRLLEATKVYENRIRTQLYAPYL